MDSSVFISTCVYIMYVYVRLIREVMNMRESGGAQKVMNERRTGRGWAGDNINTVFMYEILKMFKK